MKIKRHKDLQESYNITCDWLRDFAKGYSEDMAKKANLEHLDSNMREVILKNRRFGTIEDKMKDIKDRIGFDIVKKMHQESEEIKLSTTAKLSNEDLKILVSNILRFIKDMVKDKKDRGEEVDVFMVLDRCREEEGLRFQELPLDLDKLKEYISELIDENKQPIEGVSYVPQEPIDSGDAEDHQADYSRHAEPSSY